MVLSSESAIGELRLSACIGEEQSALDFFRPWPRVGWLSDVSPRALLVRILQGTIEALVDVFALWDGRTRARTGTRRGRPVAGW